MELTKTLRTPAMRLPRCQLRTDCIPVKSDSLEFVLENVSLATFFCNMNFIKEHREWQGIAAPVKHIFSSSVLEMSEHQWRLSCWIVKGEQWWPEVGLKKSFIQGIKKRALALGMKLCSWFCTNEWDVKQVLMLGEILLVCVNVSVYGSDGSFHISSSNSSHTTTSDLPKTIQGEDTVLGLYE